MTMINLTDETALVLGGSRGIGAATAKILARQGAHVALTYAKAKEPAEATATEIREIGRKAVALEADARKPGAYASAVQAASEELGKLDILVVSGGVFDLPAIGEVDAERLDQSFDVHVRAVFEAARSALPLMNDGGSIVTVSSMLAEIAPFPGLTVYTASKAAESGFSKALAREVGSRGITVNAIQPGPINTEMNPGDTEQNPMAETQIAMTALGRFGEPEEVGNLVAFLASPEARFISGQAINIDGGWTA